MFVGPLIALSVVHLAAASSLRGKVSLTAATPTMALSMDDERPSAPSPWPIFPPTLLLHARTSLPQPRQPRARVSTQPNNAPRLLHRATVTNVRAAHACACPSTSRQEVPASKPTEHRIRREEGEEEMKDREEMRCSIQGFALMPSPTWDTGTRGCALANSQMHALCHLDHTLL